MAVVDHYDRLFSLNLTAAQKGETASVANHVRRG
jgi:hypothetical protein